jgi:hypothetical protein
LKKSIGAVLKLYDISPRQVYTVTTDNGANFVKCVSLLVDEQEQERSDPYGISETIDSVVSGIEYDNELLQSLEDTDFDLNDENPVSIRGVKCAAHTLQLAVEDAIKEASKGPQSVEEAFEQSRNVVKHLRTPTLSYMLRAQNLNKPVIDCETR